MKRLTTCAAAGVLALTLAAPANAATIGMKDKDGNCPVMLTSAEKQYAMDLFDESKMLGEHERARDIAAAIETVYPGVMEANERTLRGEKADYSKILPPQLIDVYAAAHRTVTTTEPTTRATMEDIDVDHWMIGPMTSVMPAPFPVMGLSDSANTQLREAWMDTPSGKLASKHMRIDDANATAAKACCDGAPKDVAYPKADMKDMNDTKDMKDMKDMSSSKDANIPAIVGGAIAAVLAIAGLVAALPMLGINVPLPMGMPRM